MSDIRLLFPRRLLFFRRNSPVWGCARHAGVSDPRSSGLSVVMADIPFLEPTEGRRPHQHVRTQAQGRPPPPRSWATCTGDDVEPQDPCRSCSRGHHQPPTPPVGAGFRPLGLWDASPLQPSRVVPDPSSRSPLEERPDRSEEEETLVHFPSCQAQYYPGNFCAVQRPP